MHFCHSEECITSSYIVLHCCLPLHKKILLNSIMSHPRSPHVKHKVRTPVCHKGKGQCWLRAGWRIFSWAYFFTPNMSVEK